MSSGALLAATSFYVSCATSHCDIGIQYDIYLHIYAYTEVEVENKHSNRNRKRSKSQITDQGELNV